MIASYEKVTHSLSDETIQTGTRWPHCRIALHVVNGLEAQLPLASYANALLLREAIPYNSTSV